MTDEETVKRSGRLEGAVDGSGAIVVSQVGVRAIKGRVRPKLVQDLFEEWVSLPDSDIQKREAYRLFLGKDKRRGGVVRDSECEAFYRRIIAEGYSGETYNRTMGAIRLFSDLGLLPAF